MIARRFLRTRARRWGALVVAVLVLGGLVAAVWPSSGTPPVVGHDESIRVPGGPGVGGTITLDAGLYLPRVTPAPAVIVAHGFGGSRMSVDDEAQRLARAGFVVLTYSARGFGASGGLIGLDSLDYEVPDARALVDWLAGRPEVVQDGPDDPRVGVTGGSYGGALSLMLAGTDPRVDAVAAIATWNDLQQALFPNNGAPVSAAPGGPDAHGTAGGGSPDASPGSVTATPADIPARPDGVFKQTWAAALLSSVLAPAASDGGPSGERSGDASPSDRPSDSSAAGTDRSSCGRLMPAICAAYVQVAESGRVSPAMTTILANSSPARVVGDITAPTLLVQGQHDTLFGLDQADANARAIAANGTTVAVSWYPGGHSGGDVDRHTQNRITDWLQYYLAGNGAPPSIAFEYQATGPLTNQGQRRYRVLEVPGYPGLPTDSAPAASTGGANGSAGGAHEVPGATLTLRGAPQLIVNPPGGRPAAMTSLPGLGAATSAAGSAGSAALAGLAVLPGQTASFSTAPLEQARVVTGSPRVTLRISRLPMSAPEATAPDGDTGAATESGAGSGTESGAAGSDTAPDRAADSGAGAGTGGDRSTVLFVSLATAKAGGAPDAASGGAVADDGSADATLGAAGTTARGGLPAGDAVAPIRLDDLPADGTPVDVEVALPAVSYPVSAGDSLIVRVATTDQSFAGPTAPAAYRIALAGTPGSGTDGAGGTPGAAPGATGDGHGPGGAGADEQPAGALWVPMADGTRVAGADDPVGMAIGLGVIVVIGVIALLLIGRGRTEHRRTDSHQPEDRRPEGSAAPSATPTTAATDTAPPLVIAGLRKEYPGGVTAVDDVSLTVRAGQVLGLLGPNGAGKTTTLRMVMGLIGPSAGTITLFGDPVRPGAPVLSRVGSFVEGSGFLPHLSGRKNLELYWRATGRPAADAYQEQALEIAGLGSAVRRKVRTYSQGMRQRLAIAQSMLGLPDLLILDEPTNGLDPPQIHAMREVLRRYAATGRTVVVSSHLLSEVEQTCTDVVIISRGRTIAAGPVAELVSASTELLVSTPQAGAARAALREVPGIGEMAAVTGGLAVDKGEASVDAMLRALVAAEVPVTAVAPRNRLEEVFLDLVGAGAPPAPADPAGGETR